MNILTLSQYYSCLDEKNIQLTATQLISLHLFLHRPAANVSSSDPLFGPYISVLPRDFSSHPLVWTIARAMRKTCNSDRLLDILPPATRSALNSVEKRFWDDWRRVSHCMVRLGRMYFEPLNTIHCRTPLHHRQRSLSSLRLLVEHSLCHVTRQTWRRRRITSGRG